ncbi:hypothetical protein BGW36DRAFT_378935 [Talaromyces proteolyticus]|uniref:Uncharacterized protein n=1 Tax=Talaromyces proteolyticus TaxID=1131652 RepID=A0AAD4KWG6_9EURO|nr:uncharacterized protein BGW36DRAFT_378935 [Talaromyces proteolyticus]KAH8697569.1 hypothetical protein BGW36DRAFT_378935 [Talaromyces proteolyticus]
MEDVSMIMIDAPAIMHPQTFLSPRITHITNQINFAPTAVTTKAIPRAWERIPSRAFLARHKSRTIWKRFRKSMESLRDRTGRVGSRIEEREFESEIKTSANADYMRATKRQRLDDSDDQQEESVQIERGRSFLETKWELEAGRRRRKLVSITQEEEHAHVVSFGEGVGIEKSEGGLLEEIERLVSLDGEAYAVVDALSKGAEGSNNEQTLDDVNPTMKTTAAAEIAEIVARQEPSLVRSALRMNSLDGEDVALLSEFLSRAQAKRAANATMTPSKMDKLDKPTAMNSPTIRPRKALEEVDKNSPSPQKQHISTPVKSAPIKPVEFPERPVNQENREDAATEASPISCRRSTRTKLPKTQAPSQPPAVPNQIPVRRANGTEFIFLQRTEAQELALLTRKNTRRNKGNAVLPKHFLHNCAKQEQSDDGEASSHSPPSEEPVVQVRRSPRKHPGSKQVWWKEDKLVEYAPEKLDETVYGSSPDKIAEKLRHDGSNKASTRDKYESKAHTLPATPSKKVRRINMLAPASTSAPIKPLTVSTPIPKRKKLTPKAPVRSAGADTTSSTRLDKGAQEIAVTKPAASIAKAAVSKKASGIPKSKSLLKATSIPSSASIMSSAGATPVAKRVRAKKVGV